MKHNTENLRHTRWECKYHVVFIPKYRKKSIYGWVYNVLLVDLQLDVSFSGSAVTIGGASDNFGPEM